MYRSLVLILACIMLSPVAIASWSAFGSAEPDSNADRTSRWNPTVPDTTFDGRVVYFNGFVGQYPLTAVNPNVGTLESGFTATPFKHFAMLGVWKDCNRDGFVGWGDQGLFEYRAPLLHLMNGPLVCNPMPIPEPMPEDWFPVHNDDEWVREFLPIMWKNWKGDSEAFDINANDTRIWADEETAGAGCWVNQQPRGTYQSAGGTIEWLDCHLGWKITDAITAAATASGADKTVLGQVSFSDQPRDQSASSGRLNAKNPWGQQSDASYAQVWDCSQPQTQVLRHDDINTGVDSVGNKGHLYANTSFNVSRPRAPTSVTPSGSLGGTANMTGSGFDECRRSTDADNFAPDDKRATGNGVTIAGARAPTLFFPSSHPGAVLGNLPYANEGDVKNSPAKSATWPFATIFLGRPLDLGSGISGYNVTGKGTPHDGGLRQSGALGRGLWFATPNTVWGPDPADPVEDYTYYAYVSPATIAKYGLQLPNGAQMGIYGVESCGTFTTGIHNGWDCNKAKWFKDATGGDASPKSLYLGDGADGTGVSYAVSVGAPYNLRDVDCHDQLVGPVRALNILPRC